MKLLATPARSLVSLCLVPVLALVLTACGTPGTSESERSAHCTEIVKPLATSLKSATHTGQTNAQFVQSVRRYAEAARRVNKATARRYECALVAPLLDLGDTMVVDARKVLDRCSSGRTETRCKDWVFRAQSVITELRFALAHAHELGTSKLPGYLSEYKNESKAFRD